MYASEDLMSVDFEKYLKTNVGNTYYKEWQGLFGIPDYVCFSKNDGDINVISFELKLKNWREAVIQAFRYRSFSDYSFVVLPQETAKKAQSHIEFFSKYGIGLVAFKDSNFEVLYRPDRQQPLSHRLREKAETRIKRSRKHARADVRVLI